MFRYSDNQNDFLYSIGMQTPSNFARLKNLQAVCSIEANDDLIRQIQSMTQLTSIGISNVKEVHEKDLCKIGRASCRERVSPYV